MKKGILSTKKLARELLKETQIQNTHRLSLMLPRREKYWGEINQKQKIERIRKIVKGLQNNLQELQRDIFRLNRHTHDEKGEAIIIEKIRGDYGGEEIMVRPRDGEEDKVYF